jgi:hypothetical protein
MKDWNKPETIVLLLLLCGFAIGSYYTPVVGIKPPTYIVDNIME